MRLGPFSVLALATLVIALGTLSSDLATPPRSPHVESRRIYVNHEFGWTIALPFYAPTCDPSNDNQETGFVFFLDDGGSDCALGMPGRRWVSYHETYNTADYSSAEDATRHLCAHGRVVPTDARLFGALADRLPWTCVEERAEGVRRYALNGLSDDGGVHRDAILQTVEETFDADRAIFLATMQTLERITPDPDDVRGTGWSAIWHREMKKEAAEAEAQER